MMAIVELMVGHFYLNSVTRYVRTVVNDTEEADNPVDSDGKYDIISLHQHLTIL